MRRRTVLLQRSGECRKQLPVICLFFRQSFFLCHCEGMSERSERMDEAIPLQTFYYKLLINMNQERVYSVYLCTNHPRNTVLYTGVTNNILNRDFQHKTKFNRNSFSAKYNINRVVYYESFYDINEAIAREKQIKAGSRQKKIDLINSINSEWKDLVKESYDLE